jgi:hypothetical protein
MVEVVAGRPCSCEAEKIGLSDGSSVYAWQCSKCGHEWPVNCSVRGHYSFRFPEADTSQPDPRDAEIERLRAALGKAADQFRLYERHHVEKGAFNKAATNNYFAEMCEAAIVGPAPGAVVARCDGP